ncbi:MAG: holo-ACP synthase [Phycisphaerales bacterium]|nr:holo-ACP synthase [Phycisphaerales bacterium]
MRIIGHGVDIISVPRIAASIENGGESFLARVFCQGELAYARGRGRQTEHLAARFAAKEAVMKALGTGWRDGIAWSDIEVVLLPSGAPTIQLRGKAAETATVLGITAWSISLSHTAEFAVASVIATGG